jgi:hypothetical protein
LNGSLLFGLFLFSSLLLVLRCLLCLLGLLLEPRLHFVFVLRTHEGLYDAGGPLLPVLGDGLKGLDLILGLIELDLLLLLRLLGPLALMLYFQDVLPLHLLLPPHVGSHILMLAVQEFGLGRYSEIVSLHRLL